MLRVKTTFGKLRVGDVVSVNGEPPETVTRTLEAEGYDHTFETDVRHGENRWYTAGPDYGVELLFSESTDAALRVLDALETFPTEVLKIVRVGICAECGTIRCTRHM